MLPGSVGGGGGAGESRRCVLVFANKYNMP